MLQVFSKFNAYPKTNSLPNRNNYSITTPLKQDIFQRNNVSFTGVQGLFKTAPNVVPKLEILPGVSDNFISKVTKQISEFSPDWLKKFKNENYKIILSPTFQKAYKSQKVFDPTIEFFEKQNPKGTLGVTYSEGKFGKNFFVFCDKPPYSNIYMKNIINHELSHGVINVAELDKSQKTFELIKKDIDLIIKEQKLDKLSPTERKMISNYFFNKNAYLPIDEITADTYAWNKGGGCYGSGLVMGVKNPNLMKTLFPNLSRYLKTV